MATKNQDNSIHDGETAAKEPPAVETAPAEVAEERRVIPATASAMETPREARRAKREQARARKRADAAAKKANMAYAEAAAALRALDDASRKAGAPAPEAAAPAPEPEAAPAPVAVEPAPAAQAQPQPDQPGTQPATSAPAPAPAQAQPAVAPDVAAQPVPAPAPAAQPAPVATSAPAQPQPQPQPAAAPAVQPVPAPQPAAVPVAAVAPQPVAVPVQPMAAQPVPMPAAGPQPGLQYVYVEQPRRTGRTVAIVLLVVALVAALAAGGWFGYRWLFGPQDAAAPEDVPTAMGPIAALSGTPMAKVSLRANAEGWSEDKSTPIIVYIRKVEEGSASSSSAGASQASQVWEQGEAETKSLLYNARTNRADITYQAESSSASSSSSSTSSAEASGSSAASAGGYEAYHAFSANVNETISLPPGRYTFTYITPLNEDGSLYKVPEVVDAAVGKDGTALLPVSLEKVAAAEVTDEQAKQAAARIRTAMEKGDDSFSNAAFKTAFDKALTEWFAEKLKTDEEKKAAEEAKKKDEDGKKDEGQGGDSAGSTSSSSSSGGSAPSAPTVTTPSSGSVTQTHVHQWTRHDEQYWVPNVVVVSPAYWDNGTYYPAVWEDRGSYQTRPTRYCTGCGTSEAL